LSGELIGNFGKIIVERVLAFPEDLTNMVYIFKKFRINVVILSYLVNN